MGNTRNLAFWVVLFLLLFALFQMFSGGTRSNSEDQLTYSEFVKSVANGSVAEVEMDGEIITISNKDGNRFQTVQPRSAMESGELTNQLIDAGVNVNVKAQEQSGFLSAMSLWLPFLVLIGVWIFFMNRMQGGGRGGAMGFGKSKAKLLNERQGRITFDDVAGIDEAKDELEEIVEFLRDPQKFSRLGGKIPKGALLVGPPGTGKTSVIKCIANKLNRHIIVIPLSKIKTQAEFSEYFFEKYYRRENTRAIDFKHKIIVFEDIFFRLYKIILISVITQSK